MPTYLEAVVERTAAIRAPIPGGSPVGTDISLTPEFEQVKAEIDKLTSVAGSVPDWKLIEQLGGSLLTTRSKDMRIAVWFLFAKAQRTSWSGFVEGLVIFRSLLTDFWDAMFPDIGRIRARSNLIGWLNENANVLLVTRDPLEAEHQAVRDAQVVLNEVDALLAEKLGEAYLGFGSLRATIRAKVALLPEDVVPTDPDTAEADAAGVVDESPGPRGKGGFQNIVDASRSLRGVSTSIVFAARSIRRLEPCSAWPYRLNRIGIWLSIAELPVASDTGITDLAAPHEDVQKRLQALTVARRWSDLLAFAEEETANYPYWIDLHRVVASTMDSLGVLFFDARASVGREVVEFVRRHPEVIKLQFATGQPFAGPDTRVWLLNERLKFDPSAARDVLGDDVRDQAVRLENARSMVHQGNIDEGLQLAVHTARHSLDARSRFHAYTEVIDLALIAKKPDIYGPHLPLLMAEVTRVQLDEWEPALCARFLYVFLSCQKVTGWATTDTSGESADVYRKLCRIDPSLALKLAEV